MNHLTDIPNTYATVPPGLTEDSATFAELQAAGFHEGWDLGEDRPGQQPLDEFLIGGSQIIADETAEQLMRQGRFRVLRDPEGAIVASWDDGRWWTPDESAEYTRRLGAESNDPAVKSDRDKLGRNDPCWCGSGLKFKRCHGA